MDTRDSLQKCSHSTILVSGMCNRDFLETFIIHKKEKTKQFCFYIIQMILSTLIIMVKYQFE